MMVKEMVGARLSSKVITMQDFTPVRKACVCILQPVHSVSEMVLGCSVTTKAAIAVEVWLLHLGALQIML